MSIAPSVTPATRRQFLGVLAAAGLLTACGTGGSAGNDGVATRSVDTVFGPVDVPERPQRIVTVSYNTPFQLLSVGVRPVGAFDYSALADQLTDEQLAMLAETTVVGTFGEPDPEKVAALDPDLIIGEAGEVDEDLWQVLSQIAPTVVAGDGDRGDWKGISTTIATAAGADDRLSAAVEAYDAEIVRLQDEYADLLGREVWAAFSFGDSDGQFSLQYPSGVVGAVLQELGVTFLPVVVDTPEPDSGYLSYSVEQLDLLTPATVAVYPLAADGSSFPGIDAIIDTELFAQLPVARAGRVIGTVALYSVIDHTTALAALAEVEELVLSGG